MQNDSNNPKDNGKVEGATPHVVFNLDTNDYAIPAANVLEVVRTLDITPLPNLPDWALGICNCRGEIVSVVDLRRFLGITPAAEAKNGRLMILRSLVEDLQVGLIVDDVREIVDLPEVTELQNTESQDAIAQFVRGVVEREGSVLVLLDPERLMLSPALRQFETAAPS
jgi:purine-binding chemotaxis protein CheW